MFEFIMNDDSNSDELAKCDDGESEVVTDFISDKGPNQNCCYEELRDSNLVDCDSEDSEEAETGTSNKQLAWQKRKSAKILASLANNDVESLRDMAITSGGLLDDDIRRKVWPKLVGVDVIETSPRPTQGEIENHPYYRQVVLDVNRSLKRFPPSIKESQRLAMQDQLVLLIMRVLFRHPELHYYQGYHDICVTFLLVLGEETAYYVIETLSMSHLKVFMEKSMEPTLELLNYMYPLIGKRNLPLMEFLQRSEVGVAYCLSWLITWFGHVLNRYSDVVRLFDFFIVSHPWMPVYVTAAIVLHRGGEAMQQECDMACVHSFLSKVPRNLPFEDLIRTSLELYEAYTPKLLVYENSLAIKNKGKRRDYGIISTVVNSIRSSVPATNLTVSLVIAAAVLVTAVLYQAYKY